MTAKNLDGTTHTWTGDGGAWDSGPLSKDQSFTRLFSQAGTFTYHCAIHSSMTGTVQVN